METLNATNARTIFFKLLEKTNRTKQPIRITTKNGTNIILSEDEYDSLLETAELLAIPNLKESIKKADQDIKDKNLYSMSEVF